MNRSSLNWVLWGIGCCGEPCERYWHCCYCLDWNNRQRPQVVPSVVLTEPGREGERARVTEGRSLKGVMGRWHVPLSVLPSCDISSSVPP